MRDRWLITLILHERLEIRAYSGFKSEKNKLSDKAEVHLALCDGSDTPTLSKRPSWLCHTWRRKDKRRKATSTEGTVWQQFPTSYNFFSYENPPKACVCLQDLTNWYEGGEMISSQNTTDPECCKFAKTGPVLGNLDTLKFHNHFIASVHQNSWELTYINPQPLFSLFQASWVGCVNPRR